MASCVNLFVNIERRHVFKNTASGKAAYNHENVVYLAFSIYPFHFFFKKYCQLIKFGAVEARKFTPFVLGIFFEECELETRYFSQDKLSRFFS